MEEPQQKKRNIVRKDRVCPICKRVFKNAPPQALQMHIFRAHKKEGQYDTWSEKTKKRWEDKKERKKTGRKPGRKKNPENYINFNCAECGKEEEIRIRIYEKRKKKNKGGLMFCSIQCSLKYYRRDDITRSLRQESLMRAELACENCGFDDIIMMYYIVYPGQKGFKFNVNNTIVLCPNCRVLWRMGKAKIDSETREYKRTDIATEEEELYDIDTDKIFDSIGDIDTIMEEHKEKKQNKEQLTWEQVD